MTGTAQSGGCVHFERFEVRETPNRVTVVAYGIDRGGPNVACTDDIRRDTRTLTATGPFTDPLTVRAIRPDGGVLDAIVRIR